MEDVKFSEIMEVERILKFFIFTTGTALGLSILSTIVYLTEEFPLGSVVCFIGATIGSAFISLTYAQEVKRISGVQ